MAYTVDVVIVSHNTRELLNVCLLHLVTPRHPSNDRDSALTVTIVDNASTDGTVAQIARDFPTCRLIENNHNRGFAAAANQGIAAGTAPLILLLNSDARMHVEDLATLCAVMQACPGMAILGCRVVTPANQPEPSCGSFPGVVHGSLDRFYPPGQRTYRSPSTGGSTRSVDWVSGVCCLARRAALEAIAPTTRPGPLDEDFYMYFEDVDLCWRLKQAGWRVCYSDLVTVVHLGSASWSHRLGHQRQARDASQIRYFWKRGQWLAATMARIRHAARLHCTTYYADTPAVERPRSP